MGTAVALVLTLAQGAILGTRTPTLRGESLDGQPVTLPDAANGRITLLVLGASRKGGDRTGPWKEHFIADFGSNPKADYYVVALLESVPGMIRGMIRSGMRKGTAAPQRSHVLTSASDEAEWKKYIDLTDDSLPAVLLLDESGHVVWNYIGIFDGVKYQDLKDKAAQYLRRPE